MQLWQGREGEKLTLGQTGIDSDLVAVYGRDGFVEVLVPEADRGETVQDALEEAARRKARRSKQNHERLTRRQDSA